MQANLQVTRNAQAAQAIAVAVAAGGVTVGGGGGGGGDYVDPLVTTLPANLIAYPNAANTGCLVSDASLTNVSGDYHTKAPYEIITHKNFTNGRVYIDHPNVKMKFCKVQQWGYVGGAGGVTCTSTTNAATFQMWNCTVGSNTKSPCCGVMTNGGQLRRLNVYGATDGLWLYKGNVTLMDSYVHDQHHWASDPSQGGADSHNDSVQIKGGSGWLIKHNRFECWRVEDGQNVGDRRPAGPQTASQGFYATDAVCSNMRWEDNIFRGPASVYVAAVGYPAQLGSGTGTSRPVIRDAYIINNKMGSETQQSDWFKTSTVQGVLQISGNVTAPAGL